MIWSLTMIWLNAICDTFPLGLSVTRNLRQTRHLALAACLCFTVLAGCGRTAARPTAEPAKPQALLGSQVALAPMQPGYTIASNSTIAPQPHDGAPSAMGQVILISVSQQWMWVYDNHTLVYATAVTTGRPNLNTPIGTFHIENKASNLIFRSSWGESSPYYYAPEHVNYALYFKGTGYYIHDAPWRHYFGPGTQLPHLNPDDSFETGSHGCVNISTTAGAWLYQWAHVGATVTIVD